MSRKPSDTSDPSPPMPEVDETLSETPLKRRRDLRHRSITEPTRINVTQQGSSQPSVMVTLPLTESSTLATVAAATAAAAKTTATTMKSLPSSVRQQQVATVAATTKFEQVTSDRATQTETTTTAADQQPPSVGDDTSTRRDQQQQQQQQPGSIDVTRENSGRRENEPPLKPPTTLVKTTAATLLVRQMITPLYRNLALSQLDLCGSNFRWLYNDVFVHNSEPKEYPSATDSGYQPWRPQASNLQGRSETVFALTSFAVPTMASCLKADRSATYVYVEMNKFCNYLLFMLLSLKDRPNSAEVHRHEFCSKGECVGACDDAIGGECFHPSTVRKMALDSSPSPPIAAAESTSGAQPRRRRARIHADRDLSDGLEKVLLDYILSDVGTSSCEIFRRSRYYTMRPNVLSEPYYTHFETTDIHVPDCTSLLSKYDECNVVEAHRVIIANGATHVPSKRQFVFMLNELIDNGIYAWTDTARSVLVKDPGTEKLTVSVNRTSTVDIVYDVPRSSGATADASPSS